MNIRSCILGAAAIALALGATTAPSFARNGHKTAAVVGAIAGIATGAAVVGERHHYYHRDRYFHHHDRDYYGYHPYRR